MRLLFCMVPFSARKKPGFNLFNFFPHVLCHQFSCVVGLCLLRSLSLSWLTIFVKKNLSSNFCMCQKCFFFFFWWLKADPSHFKCIIYYHFLPNFTYISVPFQRNKNLLFSRKILRKSKNSITCKTLLWCNTCKI